ncbi:MAG: hypothetical protein M3Y60_01500 [Bacteroidota bacterium]|nr:hypothetical protein [Bacteroidota bacterium]
MHLATLLQIAMILLIAESSNAQNTVFSVFKNQLAIADEQYQTRNYQSALDSYSKIAAGQANAALSAKIARCHYFLRGYDQAVKWYAPLFRSNDLLLTDLYYYAEALSSLKRYSEATTVYRACLAKDPENDIFAKKIWRLDNIRFLYEDSSHYSLEPAGINTAFGEMNAVPYDDGLLFLSNRKTTRALEHIDASTGASFYRIYYARKYIDSVSIPEVQKYAQPEPWRTATSAKFHQGPVAFFDNGKKMALVRTGSVSGRNGARTLQLFFEELQDGRWKESEEFPFNSPDFSITDPSISSDGSVLYFSSDMPGGHGGKDLYSSRRLAGKWTKPLNLSQINTQYDETSPCIAANGILYFSSNGHPGLGGLDIFRLQTVDGSPEIQNLGYPMNSSADEFGIAIDSMNTHGYLSSNRRNGTDDDIYEFDIDLQTYPLIIAGVVKYKKVTWADSSELFVLPNAKLTVIDNSRNVAVYECTSDSTGAFSIEIPYFSAYKIKVTGGDGEENIVSFEIPRHRVAGDKHEIVVVKDPFE